ncbi:hypothetical protein ON010_g3668 [Phytophthora cinnamomi]|nr:hypothetical protein ON010_g3668 [Phytophthora cinnamomi]
MKGPVYPPHFVQTRLPPAQLLSTWTMDKQSAIALGVTAGLGVGYLLGKAQPAALRASAKKTPEEPPKDLDEVERLIRPNILSLTPYRCARDDYDQGILLDANENSLGPPLQGHETLRAMDLERYPCPYQPELKKVITDYRNKSSTEKIAQANTFLGVGSDEAIDLIIRVTCTPRVDNILITPPTYGMYSVCANIHDVGIVSVPLQIEAPADNLKGLKPDLPLPSFHIDPQEKYKGFVVVDEAYIDFADTPSLCTLVNKHKRLIVLQTLSKGFGLAGIRLGIAFGDPKLIQVLNNVKAPYNISKLTSDVARKAFSNLDELRRNVDVIKEVCEGLYFFDVYYIRSGSLHVASCLHNTGKAQSDQGVAKVVVCAPHLRFGLELRAV